MGVKEHYDKHLGNFYSWMVGDFEEKKQVFKEFCINHIMPGNKCKKAIDLGAGNGIQSVALAELGVDVLAIDFNDQLISELKERKKDLKIKIEKDDIREFEKHSRFKPDLILCYGDTISHLDSLNEIESIFASSFKMLENGGRVLISFRDYSNELKDTARFIPVKSDEEKILTCFLEFYDEKVRVTDILYEKTKGGWEQKVSSYFKVKITEKEMVNTLKTTGFDIEIRNFSKGMIEVLAVKPA